MTRRRLSVALVVLVLLVGCSPAETPETGTTNTELESLRQRAEQGDASAQFSLGNAYNNGQGVPQDDAPAVSWYRKAAEQGEANAQFNLGYAYEFESVYPLLARYLQAYYRPVGRFALPNDVEVLVLARHGWTARSTFRDTGWPCGLVPPQP